MENRLVQCVKSPVLRYTDNGSILQTSSSENSFFHCVKPHRLKGFSFIVILLQFIKCLSLLFQRVFSPRRPKGTDNCWSFFSHFTVEVVKITPLSTFSFDNEDKSSRITWSGCQHHTFHELFLCLTSDLYLILSELICCHHLIWNLNCTHQTNVWKLSDWQAPHELNTMKTVDFVADGECAVE